MASKKSQKEIPNEKGRSKDAGGMARLRGVQSPETHSTDKPSQLEALLDYLRTNRGFDFTGYKRTTFERRLEKRMQEVGRKTYGEYLDHLEVDPAEFARLFDTLLINVTAFFREPEAWDFLAREIVP
jgi:two-component system CheB/CheR fusion protein